MEGLPSTMANELLEFPGGTLGVAFNLDEREIGCVILGDAADIEEGDEVKRTGGSCRSRSATAFLGRVVDPLGRPLDGKGDIESDDRPGPGDPGAVGGRAPAGEGAAAHRHQGHRRHDRRSAGASAS